MKHITQLLLIGIGLFAFERSASAICASTTDFRAFVGQPPDLHFTAGVAETKYIPQIWVAFSYGTSPVSDCGALAASSTPAITMDDTYCFWDPPSNCMTGTEAAVDKSRPDGYAVEQRYVNIEQDHVRPVPVHFDGSLPAGTVTRIDFYTHDEFFTEGALMGSVNVYISEPSANFSVTTSATNVVGDSVVLSHPLLDGNSGAHPFVQHWNTGTGWNHPIAATYDTQTARWRIRNEDGVAMAQNLKFVVKVDPTSTSVGVGRGGTSIAVNDWRINGNPYAVLVATPWSSGNARMHNTFAVRYDAPYWHVVSTNGSSFPIASRAGNAGFFVKIISAAQYVDDYYGYDPANVTNTGIVSGSGIDIRASAARNSGSTRTLSNFCWTESQTVPPLATLNETPLPGEGGTFTYAESAFYGVSSYVDPIRFGSGYSKVIREDGGLMISVAPFNLWGEYTTSMPPSCTGISQ